MELREDIFSLLPSPNKKINLVGSTLPTNQDVFFRAKQKEIIDQYATARNFIFQTETKDWSYWFSPTEIENANTFFKLSLTSNFYEAALVFYNIVIDLSWTLCYVSAEYAIYKNDKSYNFSSTTSIDTAIELIRLAEKNVTNPTAEDSPFTYLKEMNSDFAPAIDCISVFWKDFSNSNIRRTYNFIKHKGKPLYKEIADIDNTKIFGYFHQNSTGENTEIPTDIRDIQHRLNLKEAIQELVDFDNNVLFPYLSNLFSELEKVIQPSQFVN